MAYMGTLREKGIPFLGFEYKKVAISPDEVYEKIGKCVISVCKKAQKD